MGMPPVRIAVKSSCQFPKCPTTHHLLKKDPMKTPPISMTDLLHGALVHVQDEEGSSFSGVITGPDLRQIPPPPEHPCVEALAKNDSAISIRIDPSSIRIYPAFFFFFPFQN